MNGFFPSMQAAAVAQMNATAMVATAKLANSKDNKETNSILVVRSSVPKFNVAGGLYTVSQWARKCVEDNLEWIVKLSRRHDPEGRAVMLAYGDGCQTLVLLDGAMNQIPPDLNAVKKIGIGVSAAPIDDKSDEKKMAAAGVLQPTDSIWDHLRYEQTDTSKDKVEKIMFIHTCMTNYGDGIDGRRRVLQVKTGAPQQPYSAIAYVPNVVFEQQVLAKWKGSGSVVPNLAAMNVAMAGSFLVPPMAGGNMVAHAVATAAAATAPPEEKETVIMFNPKELILLEKAWDDKLTNRDLKSKADKWSEEDKKTCQLVIRRARAEFNLVARKKRKKNDGSAAKLAMKKDASATKTSTNATPKMEETKDSGKVASNDGPTKNAPEPVEGNSSAKKAAVAKKPESSKKKKDDKEDVITKTQKTPTSSKKSDGPKEAKSSSKKAVKTEKESPKDTKEAVDSDDEPISKLKETPNDKKKSSSAPKSAKSSAKKEKKKVEKKEAKKEDSIAKRGRSKGSKNAEEENPAKKTRSKSKPKK